MLIRVDFHTLLKSRFSMAAIAGLTWAASFPKLGVAGLAWVAPGVLLLTASGAGAGTCFRLGYVAGLFHYLVSLYWLLFIPLPAGALAAWLALSAYLALYPAVWVWLCWQFCPARISADSGLAFPERITSMTIGSRQVWALGSAAVWVALEMTQARLFSGFPWNFLGSSQYAILPVIQFASFTGVYGISFLIVWFSVSLVCALAVMARKPDAVRIWFGDLMVPMLALMCLAWFGVQRITARAVRGKTLSVALIQPSIPQTLIWDPSENTNRFRQLIALTERALADKSDLIIWPEAAVPNLIRYDPESFAAITNLVITHGAWMILGADDAVPRTPSEGGREVDYYNSSFLITPQGEIKGEYRKRRLVAFGEYIPLVRWLPFLRNLIPVGDGFTPGDRPMPFAMPDLGVTTSVLICFEDVFPHVAREYVEDEIDFLLNLTNNGWFGASAAQWQHAAGAVFRAIENGLPLVRCANNGLSCWVDSVGRMHDVYFPGTRDIYGAGYKRVRIPIAEALREPTLYQRYGDWFGWTCVGIAAGLLAVTLLDRRRLIAE
jgi:apolipoprotein N-acyltransferase